MTKTAKIDRLREILGESDLVDLSNDREFSDFVLSAIACTEIGFENFAEDINLTAESMRGWAYDGSLLEVSERKVVMRMLQKLLRSKTQDILR